MKFLVSLVLVTALVAVALFASSVPALSGLALVAVPYAALAVFLAGMIARVVGWARSPVPFHIPTTCGQQRSLPWIRWSKIESPAGTAGVVTRMALAVLLFRSLFRNTRTELHGDRLAYPSSKWLWLGALGFHWAMLVVLVRHLRLFVEPVPSLVLALSKIDGFLQIGLPEVYATSVVFLVALGYLLLRRLVLPRVRYISLPADYFPLLLLLAIGTSGVLLRHFAKTDVEAVKAFALGLVTLRPQIPAGLHYLFYVHVMLVSTLFAYFPLSKLVHAGGVFLSPTRNLANDSRAVRHVNPWNPKVEVHTYQQYEDEFRDRMKSAGIPVEKE